MENKITVKDLRIGCYVNKGVVEVINNDSAFCYIPKKGQSIFHKLHGDYFKFEDIEPLEITEDILKSFGFNSVNSGNADYLISPNNKIYYTEGQFSFSSDREIITLKGIHHLQNLYYDLYNEWLS